MREIKFRAWNKKVTKMWSWELMKRSNIYGLNHILSPDEWILLPCHNDIILMQFTGLKDRNGKDIYSGDIIEGVLREYSVKTMGEVAYDGYWCSFGMRNLGGFTFLWKIADIEIIGNKYETPELLEE